MSFLAARPATRLLVAALILLMAVAGGVFAIRRRADVEPSPAPSSSASRLPPRPSASAPPAPSSSAVPQRPPLLDENPDNVAAQREVLYQNLASQLGLSPEVIGKVRGIFERSRWMSQGNPKITRHPMSRAECSRIRAEHDFKPGDARCGAPNMVPLYDPSAGETPETAKACIDQYEFPNIACDYPVIWVKSKEAAELCEAVGKRLCDAHEWEGGCAGALKPPEQEYAFGQRRLMQEYLHNKEREIVWAYGKKKNHALCASNSSKSPKCYTPTWELCGSNTYPAGAFPECVSPLGVYDQHGNAAEHMNLPLVESELMSRGGSGENEMKGSWFIFQRWEAHEDDCRWRAPSWHAGKVLADDSHRNYHLGFRCCKNL